MRVATRRFVPALTVVCLAAVLTRAQQPASAAIGGSVLDAQGKPLPGAAVVIFPSDATGWATPEPRTIQRAATDGGQFLFGGLPAGDYRIAIASAESLSDWPSITALTRLVKGALPVAVSADERVALEIEIAKEGNAIRLAGATMSRTARISTRGGPPISGGVVLPGGRRGGLPPPARPPGPGVVSGRITDADGKPVAGLEVRTMRWLNREDGSAVLANFSAVGKTDEDGRYRLTGRQPGEYLIVAAAYPLGGIDAPQTLMPPPLVQADGRKLGYVTTFFPGTRFAARATPVAIGAGERSSVDFTLDRVIVVDVAGSLIGPSAQSATLMLAPSSLQDQIHARWERAGPDGTFTFSDVPIGAYELSANSAHGWARVPVEIIDTAPPPLRATLQPMLLVKGRVEFRGRETPPGAAELKKIGAFSVSIRPALLVPGAITAGTAIMPNGEFTLGVRGPGRYILQARTTAPWVQVAGIVNGQDTLDIPIEITGDVSDALVVIADRLTSVLGQVADERGQPATGGTAIVFPEERRYWTSPRRVLVLAVLPGGTFTASGLPPGRYRAIVRRDLRPDQPATPALLESLFENATSFELSEGQHRTLPLTVAGGQRRFSF